MKQIRMVSRTNIKGVEEVKWDVRVFLLITAIIIVIIPILLSNASFKYENDEVTLEKEQDNVVYEVELPTDYKNEDHQSLSFKFKITNKNDEFVKIDQMTIRLLDKDGNVVFLNDNITIEPNQTGTIVPNETVGYGISPLIREVENGSYTLQFGFPSVFVGEQKSVVIFEEEIRIKNFFQDLFG